MIHLFLATSLLLSAVDTTRGVIPSAPLSRVVAHTACVSRLFGLSRADSATTGLPFGDDKLQHFFVSYAVYSFSYAGDRAIGFNRKGALINAFGAVLVIGVGKELYDSRHGKIFSIADIVADVLGGAAAYAMLKQAH